MKMIESVVIITHTFVDSDASIKERLHHPKAVRTHKIHCCKNLQRLRSDAAKRAE